MGMIMVVVMIVVMMVVMIVIVRVMFMIVIVIMPLIVTLLLIVIVLLMSLLLIVIVLLMTLLLTVIVIFSQGHYRKQQSTCYRADEREFANHLVSLCCVTTNDSGGDHNAPASRGDRHLPHPSRRGDLTREKPEAGSLRGFTAIGLGIEPGAWGAWPIRGDRAGALGGNILYPVPQTRDGPKGSGTGGVTQKLTTQ